MIFVTGGTGLVGNCVIRKLIEQGQQVRALCRPATGRECFEGLDVQIIAGDLSQPDVLHRAIQGCHAVVHSAAMIHIGWQKLEESRRVNVEGTGQVVQACLQHQARLIHISTVDTLPAAVSIDQPINESAQAGVPKVPCSYVVSKREAEAVVMQAISQSGLDAVIVHPGFMLGPYDWKPSSGRMFKEVVAAPLAIAPAGGCSLCDARDVAAGIVSAIESGRTGQSYIMAGQNISYIELWQRMLRQAGKRRKVFSPIRLLNTVGRLVDWALGVLPINEGDINGAAIAMGQLGHFYDSSKAQRELNYVCRSPDETLRDAWQWLQRGV